MNRSLSVACFASFVLGSVLIAGCATAPTPSESDLLSAVRSEANIERDVTLGLRPLEAQESSVRAAIVLQNPSLQKVQSVRSWVSFPADILSGTKISFPENLPLALVAPGEQEFDAANGLAKVGFAFDPALAPQKELVLAELTFQKTKDEPATLSFFDARDEGHTQVLVEVNGKMRNVLNTEASSPPLLK